MPDVSVLEILLHGEKIATLTHVGGDRTIFAFSDEYINDANRSLLGLGFKNSIGGLITGFPRPKPEFFPGSPIFYPKGICVVTWPSEPASRVFVNSSCSGY